MKLLEERKKQQQVKIKTENVNIKQKLKKVTLDNHNFFMRNVTKGNDSILGQNSHPLKRKQIIERSKKRKLFEQSLLKKNKDIIPVNENKSINVLAGIPALNNSSKIFAFGSSLVGKSVDRDKSKINQIEYKKLQYRKQIGKKYLEELKRSKNFQVLVPKNTLADPLENKLAELRSVVRIDKKSPQKIFKIKSKKMKRSKSKRRKQKDDHAKENYKESKKVYINYLDQIKSSIFIYMQNNSKMARRRM